MVGNTDKRTASTAADPAQAASKASTVSQSDAAKAPTDINDPRNRRNHNRIDVEIRGIVENELGPEASEMLMSNLSVGGCFLRCKTPESPGSLVMVRFSLPSTEGQPPLVKAVGRVAWVRRGKEGGMGIQFIRVDGGDLSELHRYITGTQGDGAADSAEGTGPKKDRRAA